MQKCQFSCKLDEIYQRRLPITQIYGFHYKILNIYLSIFYSPIFILKHKAVIFTYCIFIYFKIKNKKQFYENNCI